MRRLSGRAIALLALAPLAAIGFGGVAVAEAPEKIHHVPSEVCKNCHQEIYRQWSKSMHANSTALKDPIHAAFYQMEVGDPTQEGQIHKSRASTQSASSVTPRMRRATRPPSLTPWPPIPRA
jgi:hypothetical protein